MAACCTSTWTNITIDVPLLCSTSSEGATNDLLRRFWRVTARYVLIVTDARAEPFTKIFGSNRVPIEGPTAENARLPRVGRQTVYKIDLEMLTQEERKGLAEYLSQVWDMPIERVAEEIAARGVPIRAEGTTLVDLDPEPDFA